MLSNINQQDESCSGSSKGPCAPSNLTSVLCGKQNGYLCYGTIPFECVSFTAVGTRKVYKQMWKGSVCSACITMWNKLVKHKRRAVRETVVENGIPTFRVRATVDPPPVTFRTGYNIDNIVTTKPQAYVPLTPASTKNQFTQTSIFPPNENENMKKT